MNFLKNLFNKIKSIFIKATDVASVSPVQAPQTVKAVVPSPAPAVVAAPAFSLESVITGNAETHPFHLSQDGFWYTQATDGTWSTTGKTQADQLKYWQMTNGGWMTVHYVATVPTGFVSDPLNGTNLPMDFVASNYPWVASFGGPVT